MTDTTLATARGILADCAHHADREVYHAACTVAVMTDDDEERKNAMGMARMFVEECGNCAGLGRIEGTCTCERIQRTCRCPEPQPQRCDICHGQGILVCGKASSNA